MVQGVARERVAEATLPARLRERVERLRVHGWESRFVNLTLAAAPVLLLAATGWDRIALGMACDEDATMAAQRALDEAVIGMLAPAAPRIAAADVAGPGDHGRLDPSQAAFLWSSTATVALGDIGGAAAWPDECVLVRMLPGAGGPLTVVRVIAPGFAPITFGYDREPFGLDRLGQPVRLPDGRRLGARLDLTHAGPWVPHPFT